MSKDKKTMDLQKLVQHPSSLKLLILHTPFPLEISSLYKCTNLIKLDLSKNNLETFPYIGNLANLKFMFLHQNKLDHKILRNIFFYNNQSTCSPLSKSIVWVTFWGNKNNFLARHFLCNQTNALAVDDNVVSDQQRKHSILKQQIEPFSPETNVSYILSGKQSLSKNATQQEYMDQFWQQMRFLRRKIEELYPIIKIQKVFRGWIVRKKIQTRQQQVYVTQGLAKQVFCEWKRQIQRKKKLREILQQKKKQHYLLPLKQMRLQQIKRKMLQWATRAKRKVLAKKMSLDKEVKFYNTLRSNFLMFQSLYKQLQIDQSNYLMIDSESFKLIHKTVENFLSLFNKDPKFKIEQNKEFMVRHVNEGHSKKQLARLLVINSSSNVIRLNYKPTKKTNNQINLFNQNICRIAHHSTALKPLFKNQNKIHFNKTQQKQMQKYITQLQKRQNLTLQQFTIIKASPRLLKDILRCIFYINTNAIKIDKGNIKLDDTLKVKVFSQKSLHKLTSITLIQKFWRGYSFRKNQKNNAQICSKQYRAVVKIQRWIRKLPMKKRQTFIKECLPILKSINDRFFLVKMNDYLEFIENSQDRQSNYLQKMKLLQQNLTPYFNLQTKKFTLFWNIDENGPTDFMDKIKVCFAIKKIPLNQYQTQSIFKQNDQKKANHNPFLLSEKQIQEYEKGDVSHLFHFNTLTSLAQKDTEYWMKITCNSIEETKIRVLGIMLKSFSFSKGLGIKIYVNEPFDFLKYLKRKMLNDQSIFITKGEIDLKQKENQVKKYQFKSKFYLKSNDNQRPNKIQQNLLIFTHNFKKVDPSSSNLMKNNSDLDNNLRIEIQKPKKRTRLSVEHMYFSESNLDKNSILEMQSRNFTINHEQKTLQSNVTKADLLPTALKRILPLKKQIKSYKIQKRIKKRQPSFVLDNSSKHQRVVTLPDLSIQEASQPQNNQQTLVQYSTVKEKIKKNYIFRRQELRSKKQDHSFHQNFINLNNFLQQQSISQQRRRIKTQIQISAYQSADRIRTFHEKSSDELQKKKQDKIKKVEFDIKNHKETLQKHRILRSQQKEEHHRLKSMEREKSKKSKHDVKRLKVSFAEQCFPIINRSSDKLKNSSRSMDKPVDKKFQLL